MRIDGKTFQSIILDLVNDVSGGQQDNFHLAYQIRERGAKWGHHALIEQACGTRILFLDGPGVG